MDGHARVRVMAAGIAVAGFALVQGCAVVTAPYVAERAPVASHSMVTRFDKRFLRADGAAPVGGSPLYMPRARERGLFHYQY